MGLQELDMTEQLNNNNNNHEQLSDIQKFRDILQSNWPVLFKISRSCKSKKNEELFQMEGD